MYHAIPEVKKTNETLRAEKAKTNRVNPAFGGFSRYL